MLHDTTSQYIYYFSDLWPGTQLIQQPPLIDGNICMESSVIVYITIHYIIKQIKRFLWTRWCMCSSSFKSPLLSKSPVSMCLYKLYSVTFWVSDVLSQWRYESVALSQWRFESVTLSQWRYESVPLIQWRFESVMLNQWRYESVTLSQWRYESVTLSQWSYASVTLWVSDVESVKPCVSDAMSQWRWVSDVESVKLSKWRFVR